MYRLFITQAQINNNTIRVIDKEQIHHIKNVLRMKVNEKIIAVDENSCEYSCLIKKEKFGDVVLDIISKNEAASKKANIGLTIACALPKKSKFDDIIDKLTQLGVDKIIPMKTERVIVELNKAKEKIRLKRWEKIALNASQQSQRKTLPIVESLKSFQEVINNSQRYDLKLIPVLIDERQPINFVLSKIKPKNILVLIGPEGDFTQEEVNLAKNSGFLAVSLGESVLRVETAALSVASFLRLSLNL